MRVRDELIRQLSQHEVSSVRRLDGSIPVDLETIVQKATARDANDRYRTARELADDLRAFLDNRSIAAKRPSLANRTWKWLLRNRVASTAAAISVLATILALGTATVLSNAALSRAKSAEAAALSDRDRAIANKYVADVRLAHQEWKNGNLASVYSFLNEYKPGAIPLELRGWEYWWIKDMTESSQATLEGHKNAISSIAWSPNGQFLASGSLDEDIRIWSVLTRQFHAKLGGHRVRVQSLDWSPDGKYLASSGADGRLCVWDVFAKTLLWEVSTEDADVDGRRTDMYVTCVRWSPDSRQLATSHYDSHVKTWDAKTGRQLKHMVGHVDVCWTVAWSPDGGQLISTGNYKNRAIRVWDPASGKQIKYIPDAHDHSIQASAWSPEGTYLATGSVDQRVTIWNTHDWSKRVTMDAHRGNVKGLDWSPDGKLLASAGYDGTTKVWNIEGTLLNILRGHSENPLDVRWSPDGNTLATAGGDHTVKLWEPLANPEYLAWPRARGSHAWDSTGKRIAVIQRGEKPGAIESLRIHDLQSDITQVFELEGTEGIYVDNIAWSSDGALMGLYFERAPGSSTIRVVDATSMKLIHELPVESNAAMCLSFSPDGKYLAVGGISDGPAPCYIWRMADGQLETELDLGASIESAVWSPDGKKLAVASWNQYVHVFRAGNWRRLLKLNRHPETKVAAFGGDQMVTWTPDSSQLFAGTARGQVVSWDANTGTELLRFKAHSGGVRSLDINRDGTRLATCGNDRTVKVWDTGGKLFTTLQNASRLRTVSWSPDGRRLAAGKQGNPDLDIRAAQLNDNVVHLDSRRVTHDSILDGVNPAMLIWRFPSERHDDAIAGRRQRMTS